MSTEQMTPVDLGVDDQALFDDAEAIEAPESPAAVEAVTEQPEPEAEVQPEAEKPAVDDNASLVPSWRVREINEEKRVALAELETLRAERAQWQRQLVQQPQPQAPAVQPAKPDPLLDPEGYAAAIREEIRQENLAERREESLQRAAEANPDEFKEAYTAAQRAVDPALKARMQSSRDPGKTLLEWHRENKVKAEVGSDPNAWLEKKLEERLSDPAFLAKAIERSKAVAQPLTNGRPNVELPPSLNGASRSNASLASTVGNDLSDEGLWEHANA